MPFSLRKIISTVICFIFNQAISIIIFIKVISDRKFYNTLLPHFEKLVPAHVSIPFAVICIFSINSLILCSAISFTESSNPKLKTPIKNQCGFIVQNREIPSFKSLLKDANQEMLSGVMPLTFLFFAINNARLQTEFAIHVSIIVLVFQTLQFMFTLVGFHTLKRISAGVVTLCYLSLALASLDPEYLDLIHLKTKIFNCKLERIYRFIML